MNKYQRVHILFYFSVYGEKKGQKIQNKIKFNVSTSSYLSRGACGAMGLSEL
jgi:hypothetical protein